MHAVGFTRSVPISDVDSLFDFETAKPEPGPTELLVRVIAASVNPAEWCRTMDAHEIADHRDLIASVRAVGHDAMPYILNCADTSGHWDAMSEFIAHEARIGSVVETKRPVDLTSLMLKSALFAWENMSTLPIFRTTTLSRQGEILEPVVDMVDRGELKFTSTCTLHGLSADKMRQAHAAPESGTIIAKLAVVYQRWRKGHFRSIAGRTRCRPMKS